MSGTSLTPFLAKAGRPTEAAVFDQILLRLSGHPDFEIDKGMKNPSLAYFTAVNPGGLLFLRQAKGNSLNLRKASARISKILDRVSKIPAR